MLPAIGLLAASDGTAAATVDCKAPNPEWASINLGIMVCLECSGLHRQMGTHISKVRSLKLDAKCWVGALLAHMCSIGNTAFNAVWEANLPPDTIQPQFYPENSAVGAVLNVLVRWFCVGREMSEIRVRSSLHCDILVCAAFTVH